MEQAIQHADPYLSHLEILETHNKAKNESIKQVNSQRKLILYMK